jgi:hypothetical protein
MVERNSHRRREEAAAVAARRRSRRTAGEHGDLKHARATLEHGETISIHGLIGEAARRAADGRAELSGANGGAARGGANPAGEGVEAGLDQDVGQGEEVGRLWVSGIWARWSVCGVCR